MRFLSLTASRYLFQGEDMKEQVKRSRSETTEQKWIRESVSKRESKKRVVMVDGGDGLGQVPVSVSSIHDVEKAEREEQQAAPSGPRRQREWVHESTCFKVLSLFPRCLAALTYCVQCKGEFEAESKTEDAVVAKGKRGRSKGSPDNVTCALCPKAFHLACVDLKEKPRSFPPWKCPWHTCVECKNSSTQAGGFMFRCRDCPNAYCGACKPPTVRTSGAVVLSSNTHASSQLNLLGKSMEPGLKTNLAIYVLCEKCDV